MDAVFVPAAEVRAAAARVAGRHGLSDDWLNDAVKGFLPPGRPQSRTIMEVPGLRVEVAEPRYLLALKLRAGRDEDVDDVRLLADLSGVRTDQRLEIGPAAVATLLALLCAVTAAAVGTRDSHGMEKVLRRADLTAAAARLSARVRSLDHVVKHRPGDKSFQGWRVFGAGVTRLLVIGVTSALGWSLVLSFVSAGGRSVDVGTIMGKSLFFGVLAAAITVVVSCGAWLRWIDASKDPARRRGLILTGVRRTIAVGLLAIVLAGAWLNSPSRTVLPLTVAVYVIIGGVWWATWRRQRSGARLARWLSRPVWLMVLRNLDGQRARVARDQEPLAGG